MSGRLVALMLGLSSLACAPLAPRAAEAAPPPALLIENVHVFDGTAERRSPRTLRVLVEGNRITRISADAIQAPDGARVIDGGGRTLMPGLIDSHTHLMLAGPGLLESMTGDPAYLGLRAAEMAEAMLMRGFTSVRDVGGPVFGLRRAIEEGRIPGPRIFPSGAMVSQTGGHGDFRLPSDIPRADGAPLHHTETSGAAAIADGEAEVLRRVREQLMMGATQVKLMAGGGVSSLYDPLDVTQYTPAEMRAAVEAAANWGTYVTVHAYTSRATRMAVEAGVKSIDHGQLVDEDTVRLMARNGVWWSLQPFLDNENANPQTGAARIKQLQVSEGTARAYTLAKRHGVRVVFGTDILFSGDLGEKQNRMLVSVGQWFTPAEVLRQATGNAGQLLALSGPRYPYPGPLGVVAEGAMADLLLVEGDPTADLSIMADPERNLRLIIKNGRVVKDSLDDVAR